MPLPPDQLESIVQHLATRPGHEAVRADVRQLLVDGLGVPRSDVQLEKQIPEVRGRIDALLGRTVVEFKSNLRRERDDAELQLKRYISQRETESGERYVGIATDGAEFVSYEVRQDALRELAAYRTNPDDSRGILVWLSAAVAAGEELDPDPETVVQELGRLSPAWQRSLGDLREAWAESRGNPQVLLKRQLWAQRLEQVYGSPVDADDLFFQHTYLAVVAKTIAVHVLGVPMPAPRDLLAGRPFEQAGISGVVESDFFDWMLDAGADDLVRRIALHASRFRLREVQTDVLKGLYESLIDPEDRHELGEYYTPDWLAARICAEAIDDPLEQRVLDPACGSGAFLFHAIRRLLDAADAQELGTREALARCIERVVGIDIHPVAVQIARVTYLLALGEERLRHPDRPPLAIPVYLGDALQWNVQGFLAERDVLIEVPDGPVLEFPVGVTRSPADFDAVVELMLRLSDLGFDAPSFDATLRNRLPDLDAFARGVLGETYVNLHDLRVAGRNHIWGFVARNLVRPVWLSSDEQRADVVIGNPPWLSYRFMSRAGQQRFRDESQRLSVWQGGKVATHQDLSAYFFARCCELYLKPNARIAFVMPYAAMSRRQFEGFRSGVFIGYGSPSETQSSLLVRFTQAWALGDDLQPLFPVPSCVLFARLVGDESSLPETIHQASGELPRRNATETEAERHLTWLDTPWPAVGDDGAAASPYREAFRQGATLVPRFLCLVESAPAGPLGGNLDAPQITSRRSPQEKQPWRDLDPLRGNVERRFLRPVYLGESVTPFRLLEPVQSVIPWDSESERLLDAATAARAGYPHLAAWLAQAENVWDAHRSSDRLSFGERIDYHRELSAQFPPPALRVVYAASGTKPVAAILSDNASVIEHALYWSNVGSLDEAQYLSAVLNSETLRAEVEDRQARGQWGARHFDKLLAAAIPEYDTANPLHADLANSGRRAEAVAGSVPLREGAYFVTARRQIRQALSDDSVAAEIDLLVEQLLRTRHGGSG